MTTYGKDFRLLVRELRDAGCTIVTSEGAHAKVYGSDGRFLAKISCSPSDIHAHKIRP